MENGSRIQRGVFLEIRFEDPTGVPHRPRRNSFAFRTLWKRRAEREPTRQRARLTGSGNSAEEVLVDHVSDIDRKVLELEPHGLRSGIAPAHDGLETKAG